ncbi:MAG: ATP-binding cassette domain-containing protein [Desulfobacula sp.]|uniref:ATP-binding cassette domain-containing protein n=1 Tax=Desulfobacula sp. TaxID=2593537 RepID=UPI0025C6EF8D|nr:ATP-binding cassette domain-containing protein [Desulfobacula sp.]MCD4721203.1 ATP-binding cassette domain-containing protein [Desulfobacula sp.]
MSLELEKVSILRQGSTIFDPVNLVIKPGEITTIMGPSGCGKSTLLSAVSGSLDPVFTLKGSIRLYGRNMLTLPMEERNIGLLFQDDLLFPHMDIGKNLAFAIKEKVSRVQRKRRIDKALKTAGLEGFEKRDPSSLSGGQKARVSLLRSLLAEPAALLLDEPFSKLDQTLKVKIRPFVFTQIRRMNIPALLVTHDPMDCPEGGMILNLNKEEG